MPDECVKAEMSVTQTAKFEVTWVLQEKGENKTEENDEG